MSGGFVFRCVRDIVIVAVAFYLIGVLLFDSVAGAAVGFVAVAVVMTLGNVLLRRRGSTSETQLPG